MANTLAFGSDGNRNFSNGSNSVRKIPLADYRYGKEEMISLLPNPTSCPLDIADLPTIVRQNSIQPLSFIPLTEEEQVALTANVNSGSVFSGRGRGGSYRGGGGRGRGRGGRTDYHRSTSGGEEFPERGGGGGFYRNNSDSTWSEEGKGAVYTTRGGRALRDSNWRATHPLDEVGEHQGKGTKGLGEKKDHWNPLPEWVTEDPKKPTGAFDSQGRFSTSDQDLDTVEPPQEDNRSDSESPEDVFEKETDKHNIGSQPSGTTATDHNVTDESVVKWPQTRAKENRVESMDSVEEMQRRFEKAAEAVLSTEDEDTPSPSPKLLMAQPLPPIPPTTVNTVKDMERWLYNDPRGELQGPFTSQEMSDWFTAGYFTMDLHVRRMCDAKFLPLGQFIRIWGRIPFTPGPQPPPLQQSEPYWQQMFDHQHQLFPQDTKSSSSNQQQVKPPVANTSSNNGPSPIWGLPPTSPEEEQWPDLTGEEHEGGVGLPRGQSLQDNLEEATRQKLKIAAEEEEKRRQAELKLEEEIARKIEEDRKREEERKLKEEERKRKREEEHRQKALVEEKRKRAERKQREEEERRRKEVEEREKMERQKEWEEDMQKRRIQQQQREIEERAAEEIQRQKVYAMHKQQQGISTESAMDGGDNTVSVWTYDQYNLSAPSLLQIQQEEKKKENVRYHEEKRVQLLLQQQNMEQQISAGVSWSNPSSDSQSLSFLEIQLEQEKQFGVRDGVGVANRTTTTKKFNVAPPPSQSSWSKVAASNNPPPSHQTTPKWGSSHAPPTSNLPSVHHHQVPPTDHQSLSFWEECALETTHTTKQNTGSGTSAGATSRKERGKDATSGKSAVKGAIKKKEEDKVRQLFSYSSTDDPFTAWCAAELVKFNTDVDAATFVSLLLEVESTYEVHDYIKSFLGETDDVHSFAKQFLERRQKLKNYGQQQNKKSSHPVSIISGGSASNNSSSTGMQSRSSKKKKKGKMQKMSPSALLGFTVNAAERPNAGEIHSIKDAL